MTSPPLVSVVIPCRGHAHLLERCLDALDRQVEAPAHEVVVVDAGAGEDGVADTVERRSGVRLVVAPEPLTPGAARNLGVEETRGRFLAFTDADCVPEPGWLAAAFGALGAGARMVGGPVLHGLPRNPVAVADNLLQFAEFPASRPAGPATHFPTCNTALRTDDFHRAGAFLGKRLGEDIVLSRKMRELHPDGLRFVPEMRVAHRGRTDLRSMLAHNHLLGVWRGRLGLRVGKLQTLLGRSWLSVVPFAAWRYGYILRRTAAWNPRGLVVPLLLAPLLKMGLVAWAVGFRTGVRSPLAPGSDPRDPESP